ncbi:MAG TPA: hypothetical protein VFY93_10215 [Planctomycetota bacterium]|nr:hypothetical protein [Planctomycetota bacterium]
MNDLPEIRARLDALRRRIAAALALEGGARVAGALLAAVALSFLLDRVFRLEVAARAVILLAGLGVIAWAFWRFLVRRLGRLPGEDPLAIAVEARYPDLSDRLISALQLARVADPERYGMSPQLIEDAVHAVAEPVKHLDFGRILATGRVARRAALGLLALGLLAAGAAADPDSASIWFKRNVLLKDIRWPQKTYLVVDPDLFPNRVARIVRGGDLVVTARSVGVEHPERVTILYRDSEGERGKATMKADLQGHLYRHEFAAIAFPITFHLEGGDEVTEDYRIELMDAPEVSEVVVEVGFPPYAGRDPLRVDPAQGDPEMLKGGFVTIRGKASKPLQSMDVVFGETADKTLPGKLVGPDAFEVTIAPEETVLVGVRLRDTDGLSNPSLAPRFVVRVMEDAAPRIRLQKRGVGAMVVPVALVPYTVRATDDVKVVEGRLEVVKSAGDRQAPEPHVIALPADRLGADTVEIEAEMELGPLDLAPGAFLALTAFGKDNAQPEAHEGKSDPVALKVVTLEELTNELLGRQQEQRNFFEELIQRERRVRDRFLDLRDKPPAAAEMTVQFESQAQDQREIARRVHAIEGAFDQIFDEMYYNRIAEPATIGRLRSSIVKGLEQLRTDVMDPHARRLDDAAQRAATLALGGKDGTAIEAGYEDVLKAMEAMLARMEKAEGFTEIVESIRAILADHGKVKEITRKKYEETLREIFGDNPPPPKEDHPK